MSNQIYLTTVQKLNIVFTAYMPEIKSHRIPKYNILNYFIISDYLLVNPYII